MAVSLAAEPDTWAAKQDPSLLSDHMLAMLDVGATPVQLALKPDGGEIFCSNFGSDSVNLWSIDDAQKAGSVPTGHAPDALAFSADEHLLLAADAQSGDVSVIRTQPAPALFTILPAGGSPNAIVVKAMQGKP